MKRYRFTIIAVLVFATLTAILMIRATATGTSIVLTPKQAYEKKQDIPRLRMVGRITGREAIEYIRVPHVELRFSIVTPPGESIDEKPLKVVYRGLKPDMFAPGRDVILDGEFRNGVMVASTLLTQCPSKYEAPKPM